ncbi:MAG: PilN domain-containing protein [Candidatus Zixiibacteriota bacterium]|nr:MAG: PilN domain-containing protein [candidate division Zixibacteria bacterium]
MIEINLLPKDYQKKSFDFSFGKAGFYAVGAAGGILLTLLIITVFQKHRLSSLDDKIEQARQKEAILQRDIKLVDALNDVKAKITHRMKAVERLDSHRSAYVRILENMAGNVPEFVWLSRFEEKRPDATPTKGGKAPSKQVVDKDKVEPAKPVNPSVKEGEVEGYAFTLNALASFMIKMMRSDYFNEVELVTTNEVKIDENKAYNFVLSFNVHYLSDEQLRGLIASQEEKTPTQGSKTSHKSLN